MTPGLGPETFQGVTVVDLSRLLPGPFCTMLLADLGARVIKVEAPEGGDYARWYPPRIDEHERGYGAFFGAVNRGKLSVGIDLKSREGLAALQRLLLRADVVVESFRPGVLERLGLGVEQLRSLNPQLIVCSISGYGQTGPMALRAGHDVNYLSRAGVLGLTGPADGVPAIPAVQVADLAGGALYAAFGIAAALYRRTRQFAGCHLDISMTDGVASLLAPIVAMTAAGGSAPRRGGEMLSGGIPCYRTYETSDHRYFSVGALEPKFWSQVVEAVGHPELLTDAFATGDRGALVMQTLEQAFAARPFAEWREVFAGLDACVEPILTVDELIHDAHLVARRSIAVMADGAVQVKPPTSPAIHPEVHAPRLGEHTRKLLTEAGLTARELDALEARGVIVQAR